MISLLTAYGVEEFVNGEKSELQKFLEGSTKLNPEYALWT